MGFNKVTPLPIDKSDLRTFLDHSLPKTLSHELGIAKTSGSLAFSFLSFIEPESLDTLCSDGHRPLVITNNADKFLKFACKYFAKFPEGAKLKICAIIHVDPKVIIVRHYLSEALHGNQEEMGPTVYTLNIWPMHDLQAYRESESWKKKSRKLKSDIGKCQLCGRRSLRPIWKFRVHHNTYENIPNEKPEDLIVLCDKCHTMFHTHRKLRG